MSPQVQREKPPYRQIADHFKQQIVDGKLSPGDSLMSERQIATEWGVSRSTATKALAALRTEGLIAARQGAGTVVSDTRSLHRSVHDRYGTVRRTGRIYSPGQYARITDAALVPAPEDVAAALELASDATAIRRHRVTYNAEDQPLACSTSWFAGDLAEVAPLLLESERIRQGTAAYVEEMIGRQMRQGQDRIAARLATAEELQELALPDPSAVLVTLHTVWDEDDRPLSYEEGIAPPERWTTYDYPISAG
ncbi:GntR family transcriptional regulator [Thermomonospora umbrina]|uniref:GntR family transcriptional regulator n=1 Tax=Thermomonospora umbrina TaxID=111806 RepID=A0A3D9SLB6_9ACTN|nr:GntR family transcriptional regulator [Thermomonospora umbrina]REE96648.1 GntR family transcriptional regulator [Thermomonospora umbrina]